MIKLTWTGTPYVGEKRKSKFEVFAAKHPIMISMIANVFVSLIFPISPTLGLIWLLMFIPFVIWVSSLPRPYDDRLDP